MVMKMTNQRDWLKERYTIDVEHKHVFKKKMRPVTIILLSIIISLLLVIFKLDHRIDKMQTSFNNCQADFETLVTTNKIKRY